jgi:hypothetical protein
MKVEDCGPWALDLLGKCSKVFVQSVFVKLTWTIPRGLVGKGTGDHFVIADQNEAVVARLNMVGVFEHHIA